MKFMMQSCLMVKDTVCDGGSKMLEGFKSPLSATAYEKCVAAGMEFLGLVTPFEFGITLYFAIVPIRMRLLMLFLRVSVTSFFVTMFTEK